VAADWLWISVQSGQKKVFDPYIVQKPALKKKDTAVHEDPTKVQETTDLPHKSSSGNSSKDAKTQSRQASIPAIEPHNSAPGDTHASTEKRSTNNATNASLPSHSCQPIQGGEETVAAKATDSKPEDSKASISQSRNSFSSLESAMDGFLKQARELTRARNVLGGDNGTRRRRPNLGRTNSLSSAKNDVKGPGSRASSIDTLNEDGYGSAVSVDTDGKNPLTSRLSRTLTGQSLSSLLNGSKFKRYIDSPIPENAELLDDENETPAMTQLNYDDPDAMAMREEIMRLARRGNADEAYVSERLKQKEPLHPQVVVDEFPNVVDKPGGRATRRTRRSTGKQQEEEGYL
jgi:DNA replication regulator DPB11